LTDLIRTPLERFRFLKRLTATPIIQAPAYFECQEKTSNLPADHVMLVLRKITGANSRRAFSGAANQFAPALVFV
jgi:hypothetical protein